MAMLVITVFNSSIVYCVSIFNYSIFFYQTQTKLVIVTIKQFIVNYNKMTKTRNKNKMILSISCKLGIVI
jgi:hypothetical protein